MSGASEEDLEAIRHCFTSRWPYPLTHDEAKSDSSYHLFKVKRYPWAVSYGNKHLDKIMELIKAAAATRQIKIPDPKNMDAESAKSLLTFLLKVTMTKIIIETMVVAAHSSSTLFSPLFFFRI